MTARDLKILKKVLEKQKLSDTAIKDMVVVALAEDMGLLDKRDFERDLEKAKSIAKNFLRLGRPVEEVATATELPPDMVKTLA